MTRERRPRHELVARAERPIREHHLTGLGGTVTQGDPLVLGFLNITGGAETITSITGTVGTN